MKARNLIAACTLATLAFAAASAQAHARLEASQPKADSEVAGPPKEIRLRFNEQLEPAFSKIQLVDAKETALALPKVQFDPADPKVMFVAAPALQPGRYRVRWTAMSHDGHKVNGELAFMVK